MRMNQKKGFTLIEIVIALVVLVVGLVGVVTVIPMGQSSSKEASIVTQATLVASEKLSEIKAYGYDVLAEDPPSFPLSGTKDEISWEVEISDVLDSDFVGFIALPLQNLKKVIVTVNYQTKRKTRQDTYHTFAAKF